MGYVTEKFSKRLKELREKSGLTQEQLANELGVSRGAISYYEKGTRTPDIEFIDSLYVFFNFEYPIEYIMGYSNNKKKDYVDMFEFYGLTDYACDELSKPTHATGKVISSIIEHDNFMALKSLLRRYTHFKALGHAYLGYVSYLTNNILIKIINDVLKISIFELTEGIDLHKISNDEKRRMQECRLDALQQAIQVSEAISENEKSENDDLQKYKEFEGDVLLAELKNNL